MSFAQLFHKSNSSLYPLSGKVIQGAVAHQRGDLCIVDTGLKTATVCFQHELNKWFPTTKGSPCIIGIVEALDRFGEPQILWVPQSLDKWRQLVWAELHQVWHREDQKTRRIRGFILNSVKGGYAVAIAGHIAFLPRSLRYGRYVFQSQWRWFSILDMNPKRCNIVVEEVYQAAPGLPRAAGVRHPLGWQQPWRRRQTFKVAGFRPNESIRRRRRRPTAGGGRWGERSL